MTTSLTGKELTVLLTGATGFVGGAVAARLLTLPPRDLRLLLLVRASSLDEARVRATASLARFGVDLPIRDGTVEILAADLLGPELSNLGTIQTATHVLHLAANTSFRSTDTVRRVNVEGSLALARRVARAPGLVRYVHVVREDDYPVSSVEHLVPYTATKAEAELLIERYCPDLPLVVARPSVVIGHTHLGCAPSASIFWAFRAMDALRRTSWPLDHRIDVVPVDWVAEGLIHLLFAPKLGHRRYHLSAGEEGSPNWFEIADAFARVYDTPRNYAVMPNQIDRWNHKDVQTALTHSTSERMISALSLYFRFAALNTVFDNSRIVREGVTPPPKFTSYLKRCLETDTRTIAEQMIDDD